MALLLTRPSRIPGINVTYHKITEINLNLHEKLATITVKSWRDNQDRISNPNFPLTSEIREFMENPPADISNHPGAKQILPFDFDPAQNMISQAYTAIKTIPSWSGAQDV